MTATAAEEYRAIAPSGRIVSTFGTRDLAAAWRETHQQHAVDMIRVLTIVVTEKIDELR